MTLKEAEQHVNVADLTEESRDATLTVLDIARTMQAELTLLRFLRSRSAVEISILSPRGRRTTWLAEPDGSWDIQRYARTGETVAC